MDNEPDLDLVAEILNEAINDAIGAGWDGWSIADSNVTGAARNERVITVRMREKYTHPAVIVPFMLVLTRETE